MYLGPPESRGLIFYQCQNCTYNGAHKFLEHAQYCLLHLTWIEHHYHHKLEPYIRLSVQTMNSTGLKFASQTNYLTMQYSINSSTFQETAWLCTRIFVHACQCYYPCGVIRCIFMHRSLQRLYVYDLLYFFDPDHFRQLCPNSGTWRNTICSLSHLTERWRFASFILAVQTLSTFTLKSSQ